MLDINKFFGNVKLTTIEETIITYLIENIDTATNENIREISKKLFTSPSTIIRLSKKLGYSGYVELMYSLKNKLSSTNNKNFSIDTENKHIFTTNYDEAINDFIKCIKKGNILISGEGFSEIVSKYIYI